MKTLKQVKTRIIFFLLITGSFSALKAQCYTLVWADEFDGTALDLDKWSVQTGDGFPDLFGWGNNELQYYTNRPENIEVSDGTLKIIAKEESFGGKNYTSGRIRTQGIFDFRYGRMEARIKIPSGQGVWPAFWLLPTDNVFGTWPRSGEIDIMENFGQDDYMSSTIHYQNGSNQWQFNQQSYAVNRDEYHIFSAVWKEDKIDFFIDWQFIGSETPPDLNGGNWPFNEDFHFILNLALGGSAGPVSTTFPKTMEIDYIRLYQETQDIDIQGPELVQENETVTYSLPANSSATYNWTVPSDATIVSGQNTNKLVVTWGIASGIISCAVNNWNGDISGINSSCGNRTYELSVTTKPSSCDVLLLDFTATRKLVPTPRESGIRGVETMYRKNPKKDNVNTSDFVGRFARNGASRYDVLKLDFTQPVDVSSLFDGNVLKMDLLKNLSGTVPVTIQFVNRANESSFPNGIHSQFLGNITATNSWQSVPFNFADRPDASITDTEINGINILFNPNTNTTDNYFFDNIRTAKPIIGSISGDQLVENPSLEIYTYSAPTILGSDYKWITESEVNVSSGENSEIALLTFDNGNYTTPLKVEVETSQGCVYEYKTEVTVSENVGIENELLQFVTFSPNPFKNELKISSSNHNSINYTLFSSTGREIKNGIIEGVSSIYTHNLPSGVYFLNLRSDASETSIKLVKE